MYGKFFSSTYTGSMFGAGSDVFAVWGYVIAHTQKGQVELNPKLLSAIIGSPETNIRKAIEKLCKPDPLSRSKIEDGKRLIREGEYAYKVPTYFTYRRIRDEDDRRAYNRLKKAEQRARDKVNHSQGVSICESNMSAQAEAEAETETETERSKAKPTSSREQSNEQPKAADDNEQPKAADDVGNQDSINRVLKAYAESPVTSRRINPADRQTAKDLLTKWSVETIEYGILLVTARMITNPGYNKIRSLAYFAPAVEEVSADANMSPTYADYLRSVIARKAK